MKVRRKKVMTDGAALNADGKIVKSRVKHLSRKH